MRKFIENFITLTFLLRNLKNQLIDFSKLSSGSSKFIDYMKDWKKLSNIIAEKDLILNIINGIIILKGYSIK